LIRKLQRAYQFADRQVSFEIAFRLRIPSGCLVRVSNGHRRLSVSRTARRWLLASWSGDGVPPIPKEVRVFHPQVMYERSVKAPNGFWAEQAKRVDWIKTPHKIENISFAPGNTRSNGSRRACSTPLTTASTVISPSAATRQQSPGRATIPRSPGTSPTRNCTTKCAGWRASCARATSRKAIASSSTCR